ncbi:MAG: hypothetical protein IJH84_27730 [Saccharopolyspora sp.]|uniref:ATP-grasp domain-containing protein n=1 Tax=unclassified Saccharopolyspora TaxID=2646250 RepID=UPI0025D3C5C5|nr:ATP-grasp domain-containing protein [Saccharopolyspora sp.]MBQ6644791.1 hypothetical protein [Saccharopolyspora sp.]
MTFSEQVPTVCLCNAVDTLRGIADRAHSAEEANLILSESCYQQDQALFWEPGRKLIVTAEPIAELAWQTDFLGLEGISNTSPRHASTALFTDVAEDQCIVRDLVSHAGSGGRLRLIPHTTTPELWKLVDMLETQHGLRIELPESTVNQALRDYLDTKIGLRALAEECGLQDTACRVARGAACTTRQEAAEAVEGFQRSEASCIVKADRGEASVGLLIFRPGDSTTTVRRELEQCAFYGDDPIVVEEYIEGAGVVFPSVEYVISGDPAVPPQLTHICLMLFEGATQLRGNVTTASLGEHPWHSNLIAGSEIIARELQQRGYRGHFGIDAVARPDGTVFLLDLNARRTGSTHVHDFGVGFFGDDYRDRVTVGNYDFYGLPHDVPLSSVLSGLGSLAAPPGAGDEGVVPCELTGLRTGRLSCLIFASTLSRFEAVVEQVRAAVATINAEYDSR